MSSTSKPLWKKVLTGLVAVVLLLAIWALVKGANSVESGTYHVTQQMYTGNMKVYDQPGFYVNFLEIQDKWPKNYTHNFIQEGRQKPVARFNDATTADLLGNLRIILPTNNLQRLQLRTEHNFTGIEDLSQNMIHPRLINAIKKTGPVFEARETWQGDGRQRFYELCIDQLLYGDYQYETNERVVVDSTMSPPKTQKRTVARILYADDGITPLRSTTGIFDTYGIMADMFNIEQFKYDARVEAQQDRQKQINSEIQTARAQSELAKSEAERAEFQGRKAVTEARYAKLQELAPVIEQARVDSLTATIEAARKRSVAEIRVEEARNYKKARDMEAAADANYRRSVFYADGGFELKMKTLETVGLANAEAVRYRPVPTYFFAGGTATDDGSGGVAPYDASIQGLLDLKMAEVMGAFEVDTRPSSRETGIKP